MITTMKDMLTESDAALEPVKAKIRLIPASMHRTASENLHNVEDVLRYVIAGFYIYRASVSRQVLAAFSKFDGAYEWPKPDAISWGSIEYVTAMGIKINGPIPAAEDVVRVTAIDGKRAETTIVYTKNLDINNSPLILKHIRPLSNEDDLGAHMRYRVSSMDDVGFLLQNEWQGFCLQSFINPMTYMLEDMLNGKLPEVNAQLHLVDHLDKLALTYDAEFMVPERPEAKSYLSRLIELFSGVSGLDKL